MKLANEQQINIINDLIIKSVNDSKFKKEFISNPKKVIESSYQFNVYDGVRLVVDDQSDENVIFLNIPRVPNYDEMELSEEELEKVSGGTAWVCLGIGVAGCALYDFGSGVVDGIVKACKE